MKLNRDPDYVYSITSTHTAVYFWFKEMVAHRIESRYHCVYCVKEIEIIDHNDILYDRYASTANMFADRIQLAYRTWKVEQIILGNSDRDDILL